MDFFVNSLPPSSWTSGESHCLLTWNSWDDFGFKTTFQASLYSQKQGPIELGFLRVAKRGMLDGITELPATFSSLDERYFSLGNDEKYYRAICKLPKEVQGTYLKAVRDIVHNPEIQVQNDSELVMTKSLLRFSSHRDIESRYKDALEGRLARTTYNFRFKSEPAASNALNLDFNVDPHSQPPSNIHVLIGRNGVGKTRILAGMVDSLAGNQSKSIGLKGKFQFYNSDSDFASSNTQSSEFLNLVVVSFSAFDRFEPIVDDPHRSRSTIPYNYVGLKRAPDDYSGVGEVASTPKTLADLAEEFESSLRNVLADPETRGHWQNALKILESDPQIAELKLDHSFSDGWSNSANVSKEFTDHFDQMSAGHKIVFLSLVRLVECVRDQSLVIFDEPETHLHPPLLSSLVRALSDLLKMRNAVAIIATHSPVVLQEVPSSCVQMISRSGNRIKVERPDEETFAENVSVLTRRVFQLELTNSGFYSMLKVASRFRSFDKVNELFGEQIGSEGRALLRSFILKPDSE